MVKDYQPVIRCRKIFSVKSKTQISQKESEAGQPYDHEFVTFLRQNFFSEKEFLEPRERETTCEWLDQVQGIFRINNRDLFAKGWFNFKVIRDFLLIFLLIISYVFQEIQDGTWDILFSSVIREFIERNILKQVSSDDLVFQVFCIKQLLQ